MNVNYYILDDGNVYKTYKDDLHVMRLMAYRGSLTFMPTEFDKHIIMMYVYNNEARELTPNEITLLEL
jgi:hypothetical protein